MAIFDDKDKLLEPSPFDVSKGAVQDPHYIPKPGKLGRVFDPNYIRTDSKQGSAVMPEGYSAETPSVSSEFTPDYNSETKSVNSEPINYEGSKSVKPQYDVPSGYTPLIREVEKMDPKGLEYEIKYTSANTPSGYDSETKIVEHSSTNDYPTILKEVEKESPEGYVPEPYESYSESDKIERVIPEELSNSKSPVYTPAEEISENIKIVASVPSEGIEVVQKNVVKVDSKYDGPSEYENYTEHSPLKQDYASNTGIVSIPDLTIRGAVNDYLAKTAPLGAAGNYYWHSGVRGVMEYASQLLVNGGDLMELYNFGENAHNAYKRIKAAFKDGGTLQGILTIFKIFDEASAHPVQSEGIMTTIDNLLSNIPVLNVLFTKQYSLTLNHSTYKHEEIYNKGVNRTAEALGIYEGGNFGLYWNAKVYAGHNIPNDALEKIIKKLCGDPTGSQPSPKVFGHEYSDGYHNPKEYISQISNRVGDEPITHINLRDFTIDKEGPDPLIFNGVRNHYEPNPNYVAGSNQETYIRVEDSEDTRELRVKSFGQVFRDTGLMSGMYNPSNNNKRINLSPGRDTRKIIDSSTPKLVKGSNHILNADQVVGLNPIMNRGKIHNVSKSNSSVLAKTTVFTGWKAGAISTIGGLIKSKIQFPYRVPLKDLSGSITNLTDEDIVKSYGGTILNGLESYEKYRNDLANELNSLSDTEMGPDDTYYGYFPYKWSQVFQNFEISSNGNWNVSLCEFTGEDSECSKFVPKGRPTYGKWHYMPIISYDFADRSLNATTIQASEAVNVMIPNSNSLIGTLQLTFIDDKYDRIFNWFSEYMDSIYDPMESIVAPYKNSCLKCTIDILDWDRTILKRMVYAIVPSQFNQQYSGESDHSAKTVSVTFSVVGKIDWQNELYFKGSSSTEIING